MLEDPNCPSMDHKKNLRALSSGQTNNGGSDQRNTTSKDVTTAKPSRASRFSEAGSRRRFNNTGNGGASSSGQDFQPSTEIRTSNPRRGGQIKRPPPKSRPPPNDDDSNTSLTQADEFEVGSLFNYGSKKQSLNHLLNFQFEPRPFAGNRFNSNSSSNANSRGNPRKRNEMITRRPKYSKEQYLQANCQFIVREGANYDAHLIDADTLVDWSLIEQVVLKTTASVPSCPICLYPPTAAKITRCGHVFCWSCILHYLALSDNSSRQCPICYGDIQRQDLKSVVSVAWKEFHVGDEIEMHLMRRDRNSLFALPVDQYFPEVNSKHPNFSENTTYSNLVTATTDQVAQNIIAREKHELEDQYQAEGNQPEGCFIEEALQYISERETNILTTMGMTSGTTLNTGSRYELASLQEEEDDHNDNEHDCLPDEKYAIGAEASSPEESAVDAVGATAMERPRYFSDSSDGAGSGSELMSEITADDLDISSYQPVTRYSDSKENKSDSRAPKATFYFYQSSDGQPIFLHAINIQMLVRQFGAFENCPKVIRGRILEKDSSSMTTELRNKLRYLKHLPVTSFFEVCEIDLNEPKFTSDVIEEFKAQLDSRRRKRMRRAREEKRRDKAITIEMNKQLGQYPDPKLRIESNFHFPEVGSKAHARSTESLVSIDSTLSISPNVLNDSSASMSFAKMLREGVARPTSTMAMAGRPPVHDVTLPVVRRLNTSGVDSDPDPEEYVPPPPQANLGDVLAMALERSTIAATSDTGNGKSKKSKKMKGQKINLTGGRFSFN